MRPDSAGDTKDAGWIPASGRSPGGGNGNPLQYSCLENPMNRGTWWAAVHRVTKNQIQLRAHTQGKIYSSHNDQLPNFQNMNIATMGFLVAQTVKHLSAMWETRVRSLGREDTLEKEMVTHSSTLAWKIPWTEEPGRLQSVGSQRVGHD